MRLFAVLLIFVSVSVFSESEIDLITPKVMSVSKLYADGYASLIQKSINYRTLKNETGKSCVNLVSFNMSGFSGGNNSAQFLLFLSCTTNKTGELSILGINPFYHFRNKYDLASATYEDKVVTINSPNGAITFTNNHSIWWSSSEQNGI